MRYRLTSLILLVLLTLSARGGTIDFTATDGERVLDGVHFSQLIFHQDGHEITYEKPHGWSFSSDSSGMRLAPPDSSQAQAVVLQTPLSAPLVFDEATTKQLQQQVLAAAPPGAQKLALVSEEKNPLQIHGQPTYGVTIGYEYFGQQFQTNVLFVDLGGTEVRFRTTARTADFPKVLAAFRGSLFGLSWK